MDLRSQDPMDTARLQSLARQPIIRADAVHIAFGPDRHSRQGSRLGSCTLAAAVCVAESDSGFGAPQVVPFLDFFYCKG